ncbi:MAG: hypothetical protein DRO39_03790 [Thermoprotei archaeon]|nr:MAG: hypothetical protein DRO39_03790 [Thermoprotei archaeon]
MFKRGCREEIDTRRFRAKLMLVMALLKELKLRVENNAEVVRRSRARLLERARVIRERFGESYAARLFKEARSYEVVEAHLRYVSALLERLLIRLETLVVAGSIFEAAALASQVVRELKRSLVYKMPQFGVVVDEVDRASRELVEVSRSAGYAPSKSVVSEEAKRILREAEALVASQEMENR